MEGFKQKPWWEYLEEDLQELLKESFLLLDKVENWETKFHDYSFIVFPAAKAYEGFLKKLFLDMGFITEDDYYGKHFRIGRSLNPALEKRYQNESVYNKLVDYCGGIELADQLWDTWRLSRNLVFHWFPNEKKALNFQEAKERINLIINSMDKAWRDCKID